MRSSPRDYETGPGFVVAVPCPDCGHTRCGNECPCSCAAPKTAALSPTEIASRLEAAGLSQQTVSLARLRAVEQEHYRNGIAAAELACHLQHLLETTRTHRKVAADSYTRPLLLALERDLIEARTAARQLEGVKGAKMRAVTREIRRREKAGER